MPSMEHLIEEQQFPLEGHKKLERKMTSTKPLHFFAVIVIATPQGTKNEKLRMVTFTFKNLLSLIYRLKDLHITSDNCRVNREVLIFARLDHRNIIKYFFWFTIGGVSSVNYLRQDSINEKFEIDKSTNSTVHPTFSEHICTQHSVDQPPRCCVIHESR